MTDTPDRHHRYACSRCGLERRVRRKGSRISYPCPDCETVTAFERVGRVEVT
jgi:ribosomal protein L37AE/L43A